MERPDLILKVQTDEGTERTLKWTYGLQLDCQRVLPDAGAALNLVMNDPFIRDYLIRRALTDNKKSIEKIEELTPVEDLDVSDPNEHLKLLDWIVGHLMYFFGNTASALARHGEAMKESLPQSPPSTTGSEASAS